MSTNKIIQGGLLDLDVEMVINNPKAPKGSYTYEAVLSSPKLDYNIPMLRNLEWKRDFNNGTCEDLRLIFVMDSAVYRNFIHQHQDHLEVTINKKNGDLIVDSTRYKFIILNSSAKNRKELMNTLTDSQLSSFVPMEIEGQCVDQDFYSLDDITIEGVYKNQDVKTVISTEMLHNLARIEYGAGKPEVSLDIIEPDNTNKYGHILVPTGTRLLELPILLQNGDSYGVYNGGMGVFIQKYKKKKYIFVYPLNDIKQYDTREDKLMLMRSINPRVGTSYPTYLIDGKVLKIIPSPEYKSLENEQNELIKHGNSISYSNPDNVYKSYRKIENGSTLKGNKKTNVTTISTKDMKDGSNRTTYIGTVNNVYRYRSSVIINTLSIFSFDWYGSDIDLIYPGMPVMLILEHKDNGLIKLKGNVQSVAQMYANDYKETHGTINIAVQSPEVFMDMNEYEDSGLKSK
jgi:hypothetical protein